MKIGGRYYHVDWEKFKQSLFENFPEKFKPDYKFKKNELKSILKMKVGAEKQHRKKIKGEKDE